MTAGLERARALVDAALAAAAADGFAACAAVVDAGGHLVALARADGCGFLAAEVVVRKAWTAAAHGLPTHVWSDLVADPRVAPLSGLPMMMAVAGGLALVDGDGRVTGAFAVSGGTPEQDRHVAEAALDHIIQLA